MIFPDELQAGRLFLVKEHPYLASALWALQPVLKPKLGTMTIDMYWRLYFDPEAITKWPIEAVAGILYHSICHLLRNHPERMRDFEQRLSNIATDAEINDDLLREGVKFPTRPVTPQLIGQPENLLAEEYYFALEKQEQNTLGKTPDNADETITQNNGADIMSYPKQGCSSNVQNKEEDSFDCNEEKTSSVSKNQNEFSSPGSGRCGSCATGQQAEWEDGEPNKDSSEGISKAEGELIRRDVANQIIEHTRGKGRVPGHLIRWAQEKLNPKVNWRKKLAAVVRYAAVDQAGVKDYSYCRPSRRQGRIGDKNIIFPSLRSPEPSVAVIADTSASISDSMLAQTIAEISSILKSLGQKEGIHVLAVDETIEFCRKVFRTEQILFAGGGGTNMGVGLEAAAKLRPLPQIGIVISDGYTSWPECPPKGMKIIVVLTGSGKAPAWANVIQI